MAMLDLLASSGAVFLAPRTKGHKPGIQSGLLEHIAYRPHVAMFASGDRPSVHVAIARAEEPFDQSIAAHIEWYALTPSQARTLAAQLLAGADEAEREG